MPAKAAETSLSLLTSACQYAATPPARVTSETTSLPGLSVMSTTATLAPSLASMTHVAFPMPVAPPVTIATLPSTLPIRLMTSLSSFFREWRAQSVADPAAGGADVRDYVTQKIVLPQGEHELAKAGTSRVKTILQQSNQPCQRISADFSGRPAPCTLPRPPHPLAYFTPIHRPMQAKITFKEKSGSWCATVPPRKPPTIAPAARPMARLEWTFPSL